MVLVFDGKNSIGISVILFITITMFALNYILTSIHMNIGVESKLRRKIIVDQPPDDCGTGV